jgi:putative phage-type endonuclease
MEQGTEEWFAARLGKATASRIADIMATTKTGPGAARKNYAAELVAERLTGVPAEKFTNAAMAWGTDREPQARATYTLVTGRVVEEIGFVDHPAIAMSGASPDGLVGAEGLVEIKCPNTATHIETLLGGKPDGKYVKQMMWQMACTGRQWCEFLSFDPRLPDDMQLFIQRVQRDEAMIAEIEGAVRDFLAEVDATVAALTERYRRVA